MKKLIFNFKSKDVAKLKKSKNILGGKGANLAEMGRLGLPVPSGFTISTKVCDLFYKNKKKLNSKIVKEIIKELFKFKQDVNSFFDNVKVNDENELIKKNRLELLNLLCKNFDNFFNFSKIES